jgi:hypothetical protein
MSHVREDRGFANTQLRAAPCRLVAVLREQRLRATRDAAPAPSKLHITVPRNSLTLLDDIAVIFTAERWRVNMSDCVSFRSGETELSEITSTWVLRDGDP